MIREDTRRAYSATRERAAMNAAVVLSLVPLGIGLALAVPLSTLPVVPATGAIVASLAIVTFIARRSLANMLAGLTMLVVRPYEPGERIRLYAAPGDVEAEILHVGLLRTTLCTGNGVVPVPNSRMLRATPHQHNA